MAPQTAASGGSVCDLEALWDRGSGPEVGSRCVEVALTLFVAASFVFFFFDPYSGLLLLCFYLVFFFFLCFSSLRLLPFIYFFLPLYFSFSSSLHPPLFLLCFYFFAPLCFLCSFVFFFSSLFPLLLPLLCSSSTTQQCVL